VSQDNERFVVPSRFRVAIWEHKPVTSVKDAPDSLKVWGGSRGWLTPDCLYCNCKLRPLGYGVCACPICGWWIISTYKDSNRGSEGAWHLYRTWGSLCNLDVSDVSIPMQELRTYLLLKYEDRFNLHPRKYEELVASVFSDFGYEVRLTSFSGDQGIDVFILDGQSNDVVGIQVKRYRGKIEAEQIRAFAGALVLQGITRGIFVTSGEFRSGAAATAQKYIHRGTQIILQNAKSFYDTMRIVQRPPYESTDDPSAPFYKLSRSPDDIPHLWSEGW